MISRLLFLAIISFFTSALPFKHTEINSDKFFRLETVKLSGSSINNARTGNKPQILVKRDGSNYISMGLQSENTFYLANIRIGSNDQEVGVLVDTGSSDLWVVNSNNTYCEPSTVSNKGRALEDFADIFVSGNNDEDFKLSNNIQDKSSTSLINCSQYGTFNPNSSDSFVSNYTSFSIAYADQTFAKGTWSQDTVTIGDLSIKNMNLAVCGDTDNSMGVLGIGFAGLEVTASSSYTKNLYTYENLPLKLVSDGIINKAAYSVYLTDNNSSAEILFGAIDQNKYTGDLVELPIVSVLNNYGYGKPIQIAVTLNSISYVDKTKNEEATLATGAGAVLLDTGSTISYMPNDILESIVAQLGLQYSDSLGYYLIDCTAGDDHSLKFNFQGLDIEVPLSSFFISLVGSDGSTSNQCAFGIVSTTYPYSTFGDSFLTHAYMVVDLEDYKVALAQGSDASSDSNLSIIDTAIPEAKQPINTVTYGGSMTVLDTVSNPTMTSISSSSSISHSSSSVSHSSSSVSHSSSSVSHSSSSTSHSSSSTSQSSSSTSQSSSSISSFSSSTSFTAYSKATSDSSSLSNSSSKPVTGSSSSTTSSSSSSFKSSSPISAPTSSSWFAQSSSAKNISSSSATFSYSSIHSSSTSSLYSSNKATSRSNSSSTIHSLNKITSSKSLSKSSNSSEFTIFSSKISSSTSLILSTSSFLSSSTSETSISVNSISSISHKNAANRQIIGYTGIFACLVALL